MFFPKGPINDIPALFQIMARRRPGDKSLSEPMVVSLLTHLCVNRPQWVDNVSCAVSVTSANLNIHSVIEFPETSLYIDIWNMKCWWHFGYIQSEGNERKLNQKQSFYIELLSAKCLISSRRFFSPSWQFFLTLRLNAVHHCFAKDHDDYQNVCIFNTKW